DIRRVARPEQEAKGVRAAHALRLLLRACHTPYRSGPSKLNRPLASQENPVILGKGGEMGDLIMLSQTQHSLLEVEQVGSVTVARLAPAELLDDQTITTMGTHLFALVDEMDCRRILLDFGNVRRLASAMLGKVIALHRKLKPKGGRLALCRLDSELAGIIRVLQLNRLFGIFGDRQGEDKRLHIGPSGKGAFYFHQDEVFLDNPD